MKPATLAAETKITAIVMLWCHCHLSAAETAVINLTNYDSYQPIVTFSDDGTTNRAPVSGTMVEVLGGPVGGPLQVISTLSGMTRFNLTEPGFFDGGIGIVPGLTPGRSAWFQIRAWRGADSWKEAIEVGTFAGESAVFENGTGRDGGPPGQPVPASMTNAPSFMIIRGFARLTINHYQDTIILSWPVSTTNFILERTTDLGSEAIWETITDSSQFHSWRIAVFGRQTLPRAFFRLRRQ